MALDSFHVESGCNKLGLLKKLNRLTGSLSLNIYLNRSSDLKELVEDAREVELKNKIHVQALFIIFEDLIDEKERSSSTLSFWMDVIKALEPYQELKELTIVGYMGSTLPYWISSPLNFVKDIKLIGSSEVHSLPAMGRLPFLELLMLENMCQLKVVGMEFLGIESSSSSSTSDVVVAFPKLRKLILPPSQ
ncbi:putative disease resistance protein At3g14460 [Salvia miltiorrhiza]|uniref:putative disease resistance protein At3g14460 n=1 Tax=Salvia miltiorrhiza TaxID=226208 RepID=UPI0025AD5337|nr:putative disease resistance protein At3g14460 [Salvia miltiorrhiza]